MFLWSTCMKFVPLKKDNRKYIISCILPASNYIKFKPKLRSNAIVSLLHFHAKNWEFFYRLWFYFNKTVQLIE